MKYTSLFFVFCAFLCAPIFADDYIPPKVRTLDNGFRYVIVPTPGDAEVSIRLTQFISAHDEQPGEEGAFSLYRMLPNNLILPDEELMQAQYQANFFKQIKAYGYNFAHITNFNSVTVPPEELAKILNRLGIYASDPAFAAGQFGASMQALMGSETDIDQGFAISSKGERIEVDRGTAQQYTNALVRAFFLDEPVSIPNSANSISQSDYAAFLARVLSPKRAVLAIAGGIDEAVADQMVKQAFGNWRQTKDHQPVASGVVVPQGSYLSYVAKGGRPYLSIRLAKAPTGRAFDWNARPKFQQSYNTAITDYLETYLAQVLPKASNGEPPVLNLGPQFYPFGIGIDLPGDPYQRANEVEPIFTELARLKQHGASADALAFVRKKMLSARQMPSVRAAFTQPKTSWQAAGLAGYLLSQVPDLPQLKGMWRNPVFGYGGVTAAELADYQARVATLTEADITRQLRLLLSGTTVKIAVVDQKPGPDILRSLAENWQAYQLAELEPPVALAKSGLAYNDFGTPGRVMARELIPELDTVKLSFANNVVVYYKHSEKLGAKSRLDVMVGNPGSWRNNKAQYNANLINLLLQSMPLGRHDSRALKDIREDLFGGGDFVGDSGRYRIKRFINITPEEFSGRGDATVPDVLTYAAARLSDTVFDEDAMSAARSKAMEAQPEPYDNRTRTSLPVIYGGGIFNPETAVALKPVPDISDTNKVIAMARDILENHAVQVVYMGSRSEENIIALVAETVGALEKRNAFKPAIPGAAANKLPLGQRIRIDSDQAYVGYYAATDGMTADKTTHALILGSIAHSMFAERAAAQGLEGLSLFRQNNGSDWRTTGNHLSFTLIGSPAQMIAGDKIIADVLADMVAGDIPDQALKDAIDGRATNIALLDNFPGFAAQILAQIFYADDAYIYTAEREQADLALASKDAITNLARKYLKPENIFILQVGY